MMHCLYTTPPPSTSSMPCQPPPTSQENSDDGSPTDVYIIEKYQRLVHTYSFHDIRERITAPAPTTPTDQVVNHHLGNPFHHSSTMNLAHVLKPNREYVEETLSNSKLGTPTALITDYFLNSEETARLCLILQESVRNAHELYAPLHALLHLPQDSLSETQCDLAFNEFIQFNDRGNPFLCQHESPGVEFKKMSIRFCNLKQQLDCRLRKSSSRIRLARAATIGSVYCLMGPLCAVYTPKFAQKELAYNAQLDTAAIGTISLKSYLDNLDRLVIRLHTAIEGDKAFIQFGLDWGRSKHSIEEVLKHIRKRRDNVLYQLSSLQDQICLCFNAVNKTRSSLLYHFTPHHSSDT